MRKDVFDDEAIFDSSSRGAPYFGSNIDTNINNETYLYGLYSSNIIANLRNRSIADSEGRIGIRKCYLPSRMDNINTDITYITSLYIYYNIPVPESGAVPTDEIYIAKLSNDNVASFWWCRDYMRQTFDGSYYNSGYNGEGGIIITPSSNDIGFVRPIINLSNYTKVRFENGNYYID